MDVSSKQDIEESILNASRFIHIARKHLNAPAEDIDTDKLKQLIVTSTFVYNTFNAVNESAANVVAMRSQLDDLKTMLTKRHHTQLAYENSLAERKKQKEIKDEEEQNELSERLQSKEKSHSTQLGEKSTNKSNKKSVHSSGVTFNPTLALEEEQEKSRDDLTSGERIHTLLQQQKHISTQEIEQEKKTQAMITAELADLTGILRDATMQISSSVKEQNMQLESIQLHASDNFDELSRQKKKMSEREKVMKTSLLSSVGSVFWVIALFVLTYGVIRLFPKPR